MTRLYTPKEFAQDICSEHGILYETLSNGHIARLTKGDKIKHLSGPYWDANSAASCRIACDKAACYAILHHSGVPAVAHELLLHPVKRMGYTGENGTWLQAIKFFTKHNNCVVVKPNSGSNGYAVQRCETLQELEAAVHLIFAESPSAAISPYYEIKTEYRVFYAFGSCPFAYAKQTSATGWQHNLSQGATAVEIVDTEKLGKLKKMACDAAHAININFATVDIIETMLGEYLVIEINAGVQARQLVTQLPHLYPVAKSIYETAILNMLDMR